ncbi:hypothetical protein PN498_05060 [Oscillatoria sp. CS-180]|uniref:hypothetical protein n=1 Tax=Oscillatoria sp. CS-180 TaxID=3021720 RepID=UPI00232FED05|nr:hypothetical protein [Oscillatoria sp. CS-180]MDB9525347.1 hypothetical protein [Oscillatoria sp. CS-180]
MLTPQTDTQTTKQWRSLLLGVPFFACLGWGYESQAADGAIAFAVTPPPSADKNVDSVVALTDEHQISRATDRHILSFTPPKATVPSSVSPAFTEPSQPNSNPEPAIADTSATDVSSASSSSVASVSVPEAVVPTQVKPSQTLPPPPLTSAVADLFRGDDHSLVAIAIGNAEGTRTADGQKTWAYYGHVDPGNQAWNQGTFSYQHDASSPEVADQKQLTRLKQQTQDLQNLAFQNGITLTKDEILNGIDLANQAPMAALDRGYIEWLTEAKTMGLPSEEAILWARTRSFLDPDTGQWNAPGLGNTVQSISQDQARRQSAIAQVIALNSQADNYDQTPLHIVEEKSAKPVLIPEEAIDFMLLMEATY